MNNKQKHLTYIVNIIDRLSHTAHMFNMLGFFLAILCVVMAHLEFMVLIGLLWIYSAYYLWQERLFRKLYTYVSEQSDDVISFSMNTNGFKKDTPYIGVLFAPILVIIYVPFLIISFLVNCL